MAFLYSTMSMTSYCVLIHHKFIFWRPSQCLQGLQAVHNACSAALGSSHPHLFHCAGMGRAFPFLSPSVCFSCHSAVFHPSNLLSAYFTSASLPWGGHLQCPSTSQMYLLNPVLPSSLQMQSYPQDLIIQLIPLRVFCAYLSSSPDSQT